MNDEQSHDRTDATDRMPSLFAIYEAVGNDNMQGVVPYTSGQLERDAMLDSVASRLFAIPFEMHD